MIEPVKVWKLSPGEFNRVLQNPGMDLGKPDRVYQPESMIDKLPPTLLNKVGRKRKRKGGKRPPSITKEQYQKLAADGLSKDQICERMNISIVTLKKRIREWKQEAEAGRQ
jgi:Response regulator containing a CheY-like receiver domain and an HTH DNA-binding domain